MQVDYELSARIRMPDDHGVRCATRLGLVTTSSSTLTSNDDDTNTNNTCADWYRLVIGNQMGSMYQVGIPTTSITPLVFQHDHTVTALLSSVVVANTVNNDDNNNTDLLNLYITGCKDGKIRVFDSEQHTLVSTLHGHDKPVTSLSWVYTKSKNKLFLVSGSWDGTAKIWDFTTTTTTTSSDQQQQQQYSFPLIATLSGHENSVCVVGLENTNDVDDDNVIIVATGSAGMASGSQIRGQSVRIWKINISTGTCTIQHHVPNDHDGPIRDITTIPERNTLLTCSNDGTIKLRSINTGIASSTLVFVLPEQQQNQHPPILLSVRVPEPNTIVAGAEDGNVIIFSNIDTDTDNNNVIEYQPTQILRHPQTIWNIIVLSNGDFGTCCQDGWIRIFTRSSDRMASQHEREQYQQEMDELVLAQSQQQQSGPTQEEIAKLPLWEHNYNKIGMSEGAVQLFNKNGTAIAAQWSQSSQTWIEVGQVMGRPTSDNDPNNTTMIDGVHYDYVFPIEVDGAGGAVVSLQIGYNNGENQFVAAQRFIDTHQLPQYHLSEIADYIQQRTSSSSSSNNNVIGTNTGPGAFGASPVATTGIPIASYQYIPSNACKLFDLPTKNAATTLEKMKIKIIELQLLPSSIPNNAEGILDTLLATVLQNCHTSTILDDGVIELIALMIENTVQQEGHYLHNVFPAIDLARLLVLHTNSLSTQHRMGIWTSRILPQIVQCCQSIASYTVPSTNSNNNDNESVLKAITAAKTNIPLLSIRFFANCLYQQSQLATTSTTTTSLVTIDYINAILSCLEIYVRSSNKNIRASVATTLYNLCHYIYIVSKTTSTGGSSTTPSPTSINSIVPTIISLIDIILGLRTYEMDPMHMILIGLGTIVMSNTLAKDSAKSLYMSTKVEPAASPYNNDSLRMTAKEVYSLLG